MIPLWTDLPQASNVYRELVKCGCKKGCTGRCRFLTSDLKCTELCQCFVTKAFLGPIQHVKVRTAWKMI